MRIAVFIILFTTAFLQGYSQQYALHSQYIFNLYMINPAYAGARKALSTNLSYRTQWVGFEGAPKTQTFSAHSPIRKQNMSIGVMFQNDVIGARETSSLSGSYAYRFRLAKSEYLSFGLQAGAVNYLYNWSRLDYERPGDPTSYTTDGSVWVPNFDFGALYTSKKGYIGLSATSLNGGKVTDIVVSDSRMETYINFMAGKIFGLNRDLALKPSILARGSMEGPYQFDLNMSCLLNNTIWFTATYRYQFGMVLSTHCTLRERLNIGYAYDVPLNSLLSSQSGTHEIFLGYDFNIYRVRSTPARYF